MEIDEAVKKLVRCLGYKENEFSSGGFEELETKRTLLQVLASQVIKERILSYLGFLFIASVSSTVEDSVMMPGQINRMEMETENEDKLRTVEAAKELGGAAGELGRKFEQIWKVPNHFVSENLWNPFLSESEERTSSGKDDDVGAEAEALFQALVLYRRVFSSSRSDCAPPLTSPSPSPVKKDMSILGMLRWALGSRVFESLAVPGLEDARDMAVDVVVEMERKERNVGQ